MIKTDILIIGAGPVGMFAVFEAGLLKLRCHLIDTLPKVGGQCSELYPKKPIYDIPGFPKVLAGDLIDSLKEQIEPFEPTYTLAQRADKLEKLEDGTFKVTTDKGTECFAPVVMIAGGLGSFEPRRPPISNIFDFEKGKGVDYVIKDPEVYRGKKIIIAGGGDSALDWSVYLAEVAKSVVLVHRSKKFRGALDSVEKVRKLSQEKKVKLLTDSIVVCLKGENRLSSVTIKNKTGEEFQETVDNFIPLFGFTPKLGPIENWGLEIENNSIKVNNAKDYMTNINGVFAIGDVNTYQGKLKLILCGFHEATVAMQYAYKIINPSKRLVMKYTTINGVVGFDGKIKKPDSSVYQSIE